MKITLSPIASVRTTEVSVSGDSIVIDGVQYDLSHIPEGGQADAAEGGPFVGVITRESVKVIYHYDRQAAEPYQSTNWEDYTFEIVEGEVPCPIKWKPEPEMEVVE